MKNYDHKKIEKKWQVEWSKNKIYKTANTSSKKKHYVLDMFPYPSGQGLHVGHPRGYIGSDVYARFKRMQGYNVLHPMGFDAFGLPAEQYAITTGKHPSIITHQAIKRYKKQLEIIGFSYDWDREVQTIDPDYYKWTQKIFLTIYNSYFDRKKQKALPIGELVKIFEKNGNASLDVVSDDDVRIFSAKEWKSFSPKEKQNVLMQYRLAYEGYSEVNWCAELGTVLANDEVVLNGDGKPVSERGGYPVVKKTMRQWFMRITAYADRLIDGLEGLDWLESTKEAQRNWIGKSEGSEIEFSVKGTNEKIKVFTTRADTLFGVTYVVLAPEHRLVDTLKSHIKNWDEVNNYVQSIKQKTPEERAEAKEKTGVPLKGLTVINPANNEEVPLWVADYVLANYGTGAVMAVPAHDERDFEFARRYKLNINRVVIDIWDEKYKLGKVSISPDNGLPYLSEGWLINSNKFSGEKSDFVAKKKITEFVGGKLVTRYKMRDAIFARQRYWGEPIPLTTDSHGLIHEVTKLPLKLPNVKSYKPTGNGESPLAGVSSWVKAGYETNTMPGWAGSSWYFIRYMDPKNKRALVGETAVKYWKNVDMYVGGTEHNTGHLLYARFWHKVLKDYGIVPTEEPFVALRHQGMIGGADGRKMSKRWGNVVNPDDVVATYGADTLRVFEMFLGPFESALPWSTEGIIGSRRFLERVFRLGQRVILENKKGKMSDQLESSLERTIKKVTDDIQNFNFNTAVSAMMIFLNDAEKDGSLSRAGLKRFLQILAPFAPHLADELWHVAGEKTTIHHALWPRVDHKKLVQATVTLGVQINGKARGEITLAPDATEDEVRVHIERNQNLQKHLEGHTIKRFIYIPGKIVNIVI